MSILRLLLVLACIAVHGRAYARPPKAAVAIQAQAELLGANGLTISKIDRATGNTTLFCYAPSWSIAYDPVHDVLYGLTGLYTSYTLHKIDRTTGQITNLFDLPVVSTETGTQYWVGLACDPRSGALYSVRETVGTYVPGQGQNLMQIDVQQQTVSWVAPQQDGMPGEQDIGADAQGNLWTGSLYQINLDTGKVINPGPDAPPVGDVMSFYALKFEPGSGTLWGLQQQHLVTLTTDGHVLSRAPNRVLGAPLPGFSPATINDLVFVPEVVSIKP